MLKVKKTFVFFLILFFSFSPISPSNFFNQIKNNADARGFQTISGYQEWTENKEIDGGIEIEKGATLVVRKGVKVTFKKNSSLYVNGKLFVKGTKADPVRFNMDGVDDISFDDNETVEYYGYRILVNGEAYFKNADISGGGDIFQYYLKGNNVLNKTYAADFGGAVVVQGGKLNISECNFHDNVGGVQVQWTNEENSVRVNKTIFEDNYSFDAINSDDEVGHESNLKYNWWRGPNGPEIADSEYKNYKYISGNIDFSNWLQSKDFKDPVLIIPGILGSWKITDGGEWRIDPIFGMYDSLIENFEKNGYTKNKDLFTFPYQWRDSNENNAMQLKDKISEIRQKANWPFVDVVAHSMGGLLAREYIESDYYNNDIDQLVTLGTPHNGAPEDYLTWDGGYINFSNVGIINEFANFVFKQEAKEQGYGSIFEYLHKQPIKSVQELLPTYDYLYDISLGGLRSYSNGDSYPQNTFLEDLNSVEKLEKIKNVVFYNIVGKTENNETISEIKVEKPSLDENSVWAHGYPENFDSFYGDNGLKYGKGDGTVPLESSTAIDSDEKIEMNSSHRKLPANAANKVFEIVNGYSPNENVLPVYTDKIMVVFVFSPIDIQIISPSGEKVGKDFENNGVLNEIDGAFYTGFDTQNEFITIPNPEDGEYKILTQGTGDGDYKIEIAKISENENDPQNASESVVEITGTANSGSQEEKKVEVSGNEVSVEEAKDITSPTITAEILGEPNENGWYKNDVIVRFVAEDSESGIDGESQKEVVVSEEGKNLSVTETFSDKAGNIASKTVSGINIDKTSPVIEIISPEKQNYLNNQILEINYGVTDANNIEQQAHFDENILNSDEIDLSLNNLKKHTFLVSAIDEAGNKSEKSVTFETITDSGAIISNVGHYYNLGFIINQNTKNFLETKVQNIQKMEDLLNIFQSSLLPKWAKEVVIENLKRVINHEVDNLIFQIKNQNNISRNITSEAKTLLIESLNFIKK